MLLKRHKIFRKKTVKLFSILSLPDCVDHEPTPRNILDTKVETGHNIRAASLKIKKNPNDII